VYQHCQSSPLNFLKGSSKDCRWPVSWGVVLYRQLQGDVHLHFQSETSTKAKIKASLLVNLDRARVPLQCCMCVAYVVRVFCTCVARRTHGCCTCVARVLMGIHRQGSDGWPVLRRGISFRAFFAESAACVKHANATWAVVSSRCER
jgi:hypothetical protein